MEKLLKRDNYYYGIKLSELSLQNAAKWRKQELLNLTKLSMIQIDNFSMYDPNSDLIKIRLFSLKKILENEGLDTKFWFVSKELKRTINYSDVWEISNPFISRTFLVNFKNNKMTNFSYRLEGKQIKTESLFEAIKLDQG